MSSEWNKTATVFDSLAKASELMLQFSADLRCRPNVQSVDYVSGFRAYRSGPTYECFIDAELNNGQALSWQLTLTWSEDRWRVEGAVNLIHELGQDTIGEVSAKEGIALDTLADSIAEATKCLIAEGATTLRTLAPAV